MPDLTDRCGHRLLRNAGVALVLGTAVLFLVGREAEYLVDLDGLPVRQRALATVPGVPDAGRGAYGELERIEVPGPKPAEKPGVRSDAIRLGGRVIDAASGSGLAGCEVALQNRPLGFRGAGLDQVSLPTDDAGNFAAELAADRWREGASYPVRVTARDGDVCLVGSITIATDVVLLVEAPRLLRGQIRASNDQEIRWSVAIYQVLWNRERELLAKGAAGPGGRFCLPTRRRLLTGADVVVAIVAAGGSIRWSVRTRAEPLLRAEGLDIHVPLCQLHIHVHHPDGRPVAGARIQLDDGQGTVPEATTDALGVWSGWSGSGRWRVCVAAPHLTPHLGIVDVAEGLPPLDIVLRSLADGEAVTGTVEDFALHPVAEAVVSVWPDPFGTAIDDPLVALTAHIVTARTDATGRFQVAAPSDQHLRACVFHELHGMSPVFDLPPGVRRLRVRLPRVGGILLHVQRNSGGICPGGRFQVLAVHASRDQCFREYGLPPFELTEYPAGRYLLFVRSIGGMDYGEAVCDVEAGDRREVLVRTWPAAAITGRVVDSDRRPVEGAEVAFTHPGWPAEVVRVMGTVRSAPDGTFEVLAGDGAQGQIRATKGPMRAAAIAHGGTDLVLELR